MSNHLYNIYFGLPAMYVLLSSDLQVFNFVIEILLYFTLLYILGVRISDLHVQNLYAPNFGHLGLCYNLW